MSIADATATDGSTLDLDSLPTTYNWTGDELNYVEVVSGGNTYRQTYTYTDGKVTAISAWVKQ
jgi:hypothetical protein